MRLKSGSFHLYEWQKCQNLVKNLGTLGEKVCRKLGRLGYREMTHSQPSPGALSFQVTKVSWVMAGTSIKTV